MLFMVIAMMMFFFGLYTIVETKLAKYISKQSEKNNVPCFGILGNLILSFSKLLNQKATNIPSGQHALNEEYYKRIEAIQFTMSHDDGKKVDDVTKQDGLHPLQMPLRT